jgi:hypothetical protein
MRKNLELGRPKGVIGKEESGGGFGSALSYGPGGGGSNEGEGTSMVPSVTDLSNQLDLNYDFIHRNVRDLAITAQFENMQELQELHALAYTNLKAQLQPDKPLALDPTLVLEAYKTISGVVMATVETKRKATDTLMKARALVDIPRVLAERQGNGNSILEAADAFSEDVSEASLAASTGSGIYGALAGGGSTPAPDEVAADPLASV